MSNSSGSVAEFAIGRVDPAVLSELGKHGILNHTEIDDEGAYRRSVAVAWIDAPIEHVRAAVGAIRDEDGGFMRAIDMIHSFRVLEREERRLRIRIDMRYKYFILKFRFHVVADVVLVEDGQIDLVYVSGKIKDLTGHFRLRAAPDGGTLFYCSLYYSVRAMGWIVDTFLKHHPEIEIGIFAGSAPVIAQALKDTCEREWRARRESGERP